MFTLEIKCNPIYEALGVSVQRRGTLAIAAGERLVRSAESGGDDSNDAPVSPAQTSRGHYARAIVMTDNYVANRH